MNMAARDFHNTARESGSALAAHKVEAQTQQDLIFEFLRDKPAVPFTPYEVQERMLNYNHPMLITSVRRALTNLAQAGLIVKCENQTQGPHGVKNFYWAYVPPRRLPVQLSLFGEPFRI